jgi:hypothetical protein
MKERNTSQRLPYSYAGSPRGEWLAFTTLGIAGLVVIGSAFSNGARFAGNEEQIVNHLTAPYVIVQKPGSSVDSTNLASRARMAGPENPS